MDDLPANPPPSPSQIDDSTTRPDGTIPFDPLELIQKNALSTYNMLKYMRVLNNDNNGLIQEIKKENMDMKAQMASLMVMVGGLSVENTFHFREIPTVDCQYILAVFDGNELFNGSVNASGNRAALYILDSLTPLLRSNIRLVVRVYVDTELAKTQWRKDSTICNYDFKEKFEDASGFNDMKYSFQVFYDASPGDPKKCVYDQLCWALRDTKCTDIVVQGLKLAALEAALQQNTENDEAVRSQARQKITVALPHSKGSFVQGVEAAGYRCCRFEKCSGLHTT